MTFAKGASPVSWPESAGAEPPSRQSRPDARAPLFFFVVRAERARRCGVDLPSRAAFGPLAGSSARLRSACRAVGAEGGAPLPALEPALTASIPGCSRSAPFTMKHNPRLNERMARLPASRTSHPLHRRRPGRAPAYPRLGTWPKTPPACPRWVVAGRRRPMASVAVIRTIPCALTSRRRLARKFLGPRARTAPIPRPRRLRLRCRTSIPRPLRPLFVSPPQAKSRPATSAAIMITNPTRGLFEGEMI